MTLNVRTIEFFDREKEKNEIMDILGSEPRLINFIYGPINSGKTALITNLIENLPENYIVFYINLRQNPISTYKDFLEELFDAEFEEVLKERKIKKAIPDAIADLKTLFGIPIPSKIFERIFSEEDPKNAFKYLLKIIKETREHNRIPVLIIDELQTIGDLKVDGNLIYKIFNFFIHLTKELHICHVFALSSDSLFIERVYTEAMLQGRAQYLLVDDFDRKTAEKFLQQHRFNKEETEIAWNFAGGKPGYLISLISAKETKKNVRENAAEMIENKKQEIIFLFAENKDKKSEILKILKNFKHSDEIKFDENINLEILKFLIKKNILFIDELKKNIKPQSKLDLAAIREILKENK